MTTLGVIFPPDLPPERLRPVAEAAEAAGVEQLWLWEDCFKESGIAPAAAVLAWTERLTVGIGLMPVPLRNVALAAMELATLERMFPGRVRPGIGHGVLDWMGQVGARAASPMTLLREYTDALYQLLHGATVTTDGRYVHLDAVALDWPVAPPPLYVGAVKPKTVALAAEASDGVIFTGESTVEDLRTAVVAARGSASAAGRPAPEIVVFVVIVDRAFAADIAARVGEFVDAGATTVALHAVGDDPYPLEEFATLIGQQVRPLVD